MPPNTQNPLTGYLHGDLLEEGCIELTKTVLEKEDKRRFEGLCESASGAGSSDEEEEEEGGRVVREDPGYHENLHLKWTWTEVKR
jgi:hypothetical protein